MLHAEVGGVQSLTCVAALVDAFKTFFHICAHASTWGTQCVSDDMQVPQSVERARKRNSQSLAFAAGDVCQLEAPRAVDRDV